MVWRRFSSQLLQVKVVAQSVLGLVQPSSTSSSKNSLVRDAFGLHKMIVAVTSAGKIFGIDNLSGEVIWQIQTPQLAPLKSGKSPVLPLYVLRTTSHTPLAPHCAILGKDRVNCYKMHFIGQFFGLSFSGLNLMFRIFSNIYLENLLG
jgi:ER membrane protein complex subunit 1